MRAVDNETVPREGTIEDFMRNHPLLGAITTESRQHYPMVSYSATLRHCCGMRWIVARGQWVIAIRPLAPSGRSHPIPVEVF